MRLVGVRELLQFEVSVDGQARVQLGLCRSNGEAVVRGREILIGRLAGTHAAFAHCAVYRQTREAPEALGLWRYAQHTPYPVWEAARGGASSRRRPEKVEHHLREAEAAEAAAKAVSDGDLRRGYEELARQWRQLARRTLEQSRRSP